MNIQDIVKYDESSPSGLRWVSPISNRLKAGDVAGTYNSKTGYWQITVKGKRTYNHRVILHILKGLDLDSRLQVDHIDRDRGNNKVDNLRVVTQQDNLVNKGIRSNNTSGCQGVSWNRIKCKWQVRIQRLGSSVSLGYFNNFLDAVCARKSAEVIHHKVEEQNAALYQ